jgi:hypothetical protein
VEDDPVTAALAFVIGGAIVTLPELIAGQSFGKGDGRTSIIPSNRDRDRNNGSKEEPGKEEPQQTVTETVPAEPPTQTAPQSTTPQAPPATTAPQQQTTPTTPTTPTP